MSKTAEAVVPDFSKEVEDRHVRLDTDEYEKVYVVGDVHGCPKELEALLSKLSVSDDDAVVFCSLRDEVVSVRAIGEAADADQVRVYEGGHELFSSRRRDEYVEDVLAAVDGGLDAV